MRWEDRAEKGIGKDRKERVHGLAAHGTMELLLLISTLSMQHDCWLA